MDRQVAMPAPTAPNPRNWGRINNGSSTRLAAPPKERPKEACPALPSARTRLAKKGAEDGGGAADHHHPLGVAQGDGKGVLGGAAENENGLPEAPEEKAEKGPAEKAEPEGDGGNPPGFIGGLPPSAGPGAGAAHANRWRWQ